MRAIVTALLISATIPMAIAADVSIDAATLVPAMKSGKLMCEDPNERTKTCFALTRFEVTGASTYVAYSKLRLDDDAKMVMIAPAKGQIKNGRACSNAMADDFEKATFELDGAPGTDAQNKMVREKLRPQMSPHFETEVCEAFSMKNGKLSTIGYLDGNMIPETEAAIIWVTPEDGYKVGPK